MSQIQGGKPARQIIPGQPRKVVKGVKVDMMAVQITNSESEASVALALIFGKDARTNKPHVSVINPKVVEELLSIPDDYVRDGILDIYEKMNAPPAELPEGKVGDFALDEVG